MVVKEVDLQNERGRDPRMGFTVLAFRQDLEAVADIRDEDEPEQEAEKLLTLLDGGPLDRLLQRTLL